MCIIIVQPCYNEIQEIPAESFKGSLQQNKAVELCIVNHVDLLFLTVWLSAPTAERRLLRLLQQHLSLHLHPHRHLLPHMHSRYRRHLR